MCLYLDSSHVVHVVLQGSQIHDALWPRKLSQEHFGSPCAVLVSAAHPDLPGATHFPILKMLLFQSIHAMSCFVCLTLWQILQASAHLEDKGDETLLLLQPT